MHGARKKVGDVEAWYDERPAKRYAKFCRKYCRHLKGPLGGQPIILEDWQLEWIVKPLLGWKQENGTRLYREASIWIPRKNGKSMLVATLMLFLLLGDDEPGAELYAAASTRDQAKTLYDMARAQVEGSPELSRLLRVMSKRILFDSRLSFMEVLASEAGPVHGTNPHVVAIDELHVHKSRDLYDALVSGRGVRRQPLIFTISTAGIRDDQHIAWKQYQRAKRVAKNPALEPKLLSVIYEAPKDAPLDDPRTWALANPGLAGGSMVTHEFLSDEIAKAKQDPAEENRVRQLHLNQWVSQVTRWLQLEKWQACHAPALRPAAGGQAGVKPPEPGDECVIGLDFSYSTDLSAAAALFPRRITMDPATAIGAALGLLMKASEKEDAPTSKKAEQEKKFIDESLERARSFAASFSLWVETHFWKPAEELTAASRADGADYEDWAQHGHLTLCPGYTIDDAMIESWVRRMNETYRVRVVAFDRAQAAGCIARLEASGIPVIEVRQGPLTLGPAAKLFEGMISAQRLAHAGNPVMDYCVNNVAVKRTDSGLVLPTKSKSRGRIDGVSATLTALAELMRAPFEPPGLDLAELIKKHGGMFLS